MAKLIYEGEVSVLSDVQKGFVSDTLNKLGYIDNKVKIDPVGKLGDNFVAQVKRLTVQIDNESDFSLVLKIAPTIEQLRATVKTDISFNNEYIIYTELLPKFIDIQNMAGIPEDVRIRFPKCYGCFMKPPNEIIILEDLELSNFKMHNKMEPLSNGCVEIVLRDLAKLHALSYVLKRDDPAKFNDIGKSLKKAFASIEGEAIEIYYNEIENDTLSLVCGDKYKNVLKGCITQWVKNSKKITEEDKGPSSIIQHGDLWTNNIMFLCEDDFPTNVMFIDYQKSKEASPVADLTYFLFNCTDYALRSKHFHNWLDCYHCELDNFLSHFGMKANFIYSKDILDADFRRYGRVALAQTVLMASLLAREASEFEDFREAQQRSDLSEILKSMSVSRMLGPSMKRFKDRVEGAIDSMLELGLI